MADSSEEYSLSSSLSESKTILHWKGCTLLVVMVGVIVEMYSLCVFGECSKMTKLFGLTSISRIYGHHHLLRWPCKTARRVDYNEEVQGAVSVNNQSI